MNHRIMILGSPGAGKSTLAAEIAKSLQYPVIHLDRYYWMHGWKEREQVEWIQIQERLLKDHPQCVIDGNYTQTIECRLPYIDRILLLNDVTKSECIQRVQKRYLTYKNYSRPDMADGCEEKVDLEFLRYIWKFENKVPILKRLLAREEAAGTNVYIAENPQQRENFVRKIIEGG